MEVRRSFNPRAFVPERVDARISRRYEIPKREVASGSFGKVFIASDREIQDRLVAIKKVLVVDGDGRSAFEQEVEIMKELDHPHVCRILETYDQGRCMYIVMEYCEGGELFDRIMDLGTIAEQTTADIIGQVASALRYAHGRGVAHRDLKPENVCFCSSDRSNTHCKVIDWGVGFHFGLSTMRTSVGSGAYAAPEVFGGYTRTGYTSACDLWSLGVVTYVMLCGRPPFWGSCTEQLRNMRSEQFPLSSSTWEAVSADAKDLIKGLLRSDPSRRLAIDEVLAHPWLMVQHGQMDPAIGRQILFNMRQFSKTSQFFSICVASVARQLDHRSLRDVHRVFREMDTNGDGVLQLSEVKIGMENIFGPGSEQVRDVEWMFSRLDLDGSGTIDYTEFCAASIGERKSMEVSVLWAAFKAFDVDDDDGRITKDEIKQVLSKADVDKVWSSDVCEKVAEELLDKFDRDGDGSLDFEEWLSLARECASRPREACEMALATGQDCGARGDCECELLAELAKEEPEHGVSGFGRAYGLLAELGGKPLGGQESAAVAGGA